MTNECRICRTDDELQIVYGEVYAPNVPDVHGEFMTPVEVRKMAHQFMRNQLLDQVDTNHDNELNGSMIVESFIASEKSELYLPDAWVIGMHVPDPTMWASIKKGDINGFSMEALVQIKEKVIEIDLPDAGVIQGVTSAPTGEKSEGHQHRFEVRFDEEGNFLGGLTSVDEGHRHEILRGTVTETANGHEHRFSFAEDMQVVDSRAA